MKSEKPDLVVCSFCIFGDHSRCLPPPGALACACAEDFHRPSRRVREWIVRSNRPDVTDPDQVAGLMVQVEERDCA